VGLGVLHDWLGLLFDWQSYHVVQVKKLPLPPPDDEEEDINNDRNWPLVMAIIVFIAVVGTLLVMWVRGTI